jgi:hypothetical protein
MITKPEQICVQKTELSQPAKIAWHEPQLREIDHLATNVGTVFNDPEGVLSSMGYGFGNGLS